jgi:hypothetical protein
LICYCSQIHQVSPGRLFATTSGDSAVSASDFQKRPPVKGFVFTTLAGGLITHWFNLKASERQRESDIRRQDYEWERSRQFEILRRKLDEGEKSLDEISDLINLRFFRLKKVFDSISFKDFGGAERNWKGYSETVETWNIKLITYQNRLSRLVNQQVAHEFNNYETSGPHLLTPKSIHGKFFVAHKKALALLRCAKRRGCKITPGMLEETERILNDLDSHSDSFVDRVSVIFFEQAVMLGKLK